MNCLKNELYSNDISRVADLIPVSKIAGKSFLITGATGLICSCIVDMLLWINRKHDAKILIYVAGRNAAALEERFDIASTGNIFAVDYDATKEIDFNFKSDFIIHGASNASPDKYVKEPVDTMLSNFFGMHNILKYAFQTNAQKTIYISSSEVYGKTATELPILETDYGFSDILAVRSSYTSSKRATETLCVSFAEQYGVPVSIVRPGHIYGPTATSKDNRISSAFAMAAARGDDLVMKSAGSQMRSYCYSVDCASAILWAALFGENGEAYNISNKNSIITIKQMAEKLAQSGNVILHQAVADAEAKKQFNPMDNSSLNSEKLEALGWKGLFDADVGLSHTVQILRELYV